MEISTKDTSTLSTIAQLIIVGDEKDVLEAKILRACLETDFAKKIAAEILLSNNQICSRPAQNYIDWARIQKEKSNI